MRAVAASIANLQILIRAAFFILPVATLSQTVMRLYAKPLAFHTRRQSL